MEIWSREGSKVALSPMDMEESPAPGPELGFGRTDLRARVGRTERSLRRRLAPL